MVCMHFKLLVWADHYQQVLQLVLSFSEYASSQFQALLTAKCDEVQ